MAHNARFFPVVSPPTNGSEQPNGKQDSVQSNPYLPVHFSGDDKNYEHAQYTPFFPKIDWAPLEPVKVTDKALAADPVKKALLSAASKVKDLTPSIGTEIVGIDLRALTNSQKDELALLVAERGVVCTYKPIYKSIRMLIDIWAVFRDQLIDIHQQLELAAYFGPLHKHATTGIPKAAADDSQLQAVHVVYNDKTRKPDASAFAITELWHSDVSYELQPPSTTILKVIHGPDVGGDTLWSSG